MMKFAERLRKTMTEVFEKGMQNACRGAFARWRNLLYAVKLHEYFLQRRHMVGWAGVLHRKHIMLKIMEKIMHVSLGGSFESWHTVLIQSKGSVSLRTVVAKRMEFKLFHLWRVRRQTQAALRVFASRIGAGCLAVFWQALKQGVTKQRAAETVLAREVCQKVSEAWGRCFLYQSFFRWGHYAHICALCKDMQLVSGDKILREIVGAWGKHTAREVALKQCAMKIIRRIQNRCTGSVFQSWALFTERSVKVKTFVIGILTTGIQARFARWAAYTSVCLRQHGLIEATIAARQMLTLTSHLRKWSTLTQVLRHVAMVFGQHSEGLQRKIFSCWVTWVDNKIEMRASVALMQSELTLRPVCGSVVLECTYRWATLDLELPFSYWKRSWSVKDFRKKATKIGLTKHFQGYSRKCFDSWYFSAMIKKKGMVAMARHMDKDRKLAFDKWVNKVDEEVYLRVILRDAMVHQETYLHRVCFRLWRRQVHLSNGVLFLLHHRAYRYVAQAFAEWSIQTVILANKSHRNLKARCHWALALLFGTFSSWAEGVAAIKMSKHFLNLHKLHLASVRLDQYLRVWQACASRRHYLRTSALWMWARNCQATYLTAWLLVVAGSIALKRKVMLAVNNVRRRFFTKWREVARRFSGIKKLVQAWWLRYAIRRMFSEWAVNVSLVKMFAVIQQQQLQMRKPQIMRNHLCHWRLEVVGEAKFRVVMRKFAPMRKQYDLQAHFSEWWIMVGVLQRDRIVQSEVEALHAGYMQYQSLKQWRRQYLLKLGFRAHRQKHFCKKVFTPWHLDAAKSARQQRAVYRLVNRVVYSAFLKWRERAADAKHKKGLIRKTLNKLLRQAQLKSFIRWKEYSDEKLYMKEQAMRAIDRWTLNVCTKTLGSLKAHVVKRKAMYDLIDKATELYHKILLKKVLRDFFVTAGHLVRIKKFATKLLRKHIHEVYSVVWEPLHDNWQHQKWVKACIKKFRPVILRRCLKNWKLGNVLNRLEYHCDDHNKELIAEIRALMNEANAARAPAARVLALKAARTLATHRNLISRWQLKLYDWVWEVWGGRMRQVLGCRRVMFRLQNLFAEMAFNRWKGLLIAINRGRELKALRDSGRIAEGFEAWRWILSKVRAVNAGVMRRAMHGWHQRVAAERLYRESLLHLCANEKKVLISSSKILTTLVRKAVRAWFKRAHKAALLEKARLNGLRVLSSYRLFVWWLKFMDVRRQHREVYNSYQMYRNRALMRHTFSNWRLFRAFAHGDRVLLVCFSQDNNVLKKRMAMELWMMYFTTNHELWHHRGLVMQHRRLKELAMRAAIGRARTQKFWNARNAAYEDWKTTKKSSMPALWDTGTAESPRHLVSAITPHLHPLEQSSTTSPRKQLGGRLPKTPERLRSMTSFSGSDLADEDEDEDEAPPLISRSRSDISRSRSSTVASETPSVFKSDRSSISVPKVSEITWIQQEFEKDIRLYKDRQARDLTDVVTSMKRADVLLLVDMYMKGKEMRCALLPFMAWKDLVKVFSWKAHESNRHKLKTIAVNWHMEALGGDMERSEYHQMGHLRSVFAFWIIKSRQSELRSAAAPHKARMMCSVETMFLSGGSSHAAMSMCMRAWRKLLAHNMRLLPPLEEKGLQFYWRVGRKNLLRGPWQAWKTRYTYCTMVCHCRNFMGGMNNSVLFAAWWSYLLVRRKKIARQMWALGKHMGYVLRAALGQWRVHCRGRGVVSAFPLGHQGMPLILKKGCSDDATDPMTAQGRVDALEEAMGLFLKPHELDEEHVDFVRSAARTGRHGH